DALPISLEQEELEGRKLRRIETEGLGTIRHFIGQVGTGPIQYRHEVIAYRIDATTAQVRNALSVVGYIFLVIPGPFLDVLMDRNALHNGPSESHLLNLCFPLLDFLHLPDRSVWNMVQCGDDSGCPRLFYVHKAYRVLGTVPPPCLFQCHNAILKQ